MTNATVICPDCGFQVEAGQFCTECGAPLNAQETPTRLVPVVSPDPAPAPGPGPGVPPGDAVDAAVPVVERMWPRRRRNIVVVAGGTVAALLLAGGVVAAVQASGAQAVKTASATVQSSARVLPGWSNTPVWETSGVKGRVAVTADGKLLGSASGDTVTVRAASTGTVLRTTMLADPARGGVFTAMNGTRPALVAYTGSSLTLWSGPKATPRTLTLPAGGRVQIRTGAVFITAGSSVSLLEDGDLVPVTTPRPGAAVLGSTDDGRILWASARGEVITAATNGTVLATAELARPAKDAAIEGWVAASPATVWVRWKQPGKNPVLVAHDAATGTAIVTTTGAPDGVTATSQDGANVLVDGVWFTRAGKLRPLPEEFVASRFVGDAVYGATTRGDAALFTGSRLQSAGIPNVVPVAVTANRDLVTVAGGHIITYPRTQK
jgi:hypothetical protein